eukprot:jgi/Mesen1/11064/ME000099S10495
MASEMLMPSPSPSMAPCSYAPSGNTILESDVPSVVYPALLSLANKWNDIISVDELALKPLRGALTNKVFECHWPRKDGKEPVKVIVRIYGEGVDSFFRRDDEVKTFERMSAAGQGPKLLARFPNGRVEEFLHSRTLTAPEMRRPEVYLQIAAKMRSFHRLPMPGPQESRLWKRLRQWLATSLKVATGSQVAEFGLEKLGSEIDALEMKLAGDGLERVGFCHNDLQYGNIMIDDSSSTVTLIDYEYACHNAIAFDIANHFCEWAADYHSETPHVLDYSKYPDYDTRCSFVRAYLRGQDHGEVLEREVESLVADCEMYALLSHIHWGLWGIISAASSSIDFNFLEYSRQRFGKYWELRSAVL